MNFYISWGFDAARLGPLTCTLTETGGGGATGPISMSGQYMHHIAVGTYTAHDAVTGEAETRDTGYANFAAALAAALNAVGNATYTVIFDPVAPAYTISATGGSVTAFALTSISTSMQCALGITVSSLSGALTYQSTSFASGASRPLWSWTRAEIGISEWTESEDDIAGEDLVGSDGEVTGLVALGAPRRLDFVVPWESQAKVWNESAATRDWTWQRALARARTVEPCWISPDPRGGGTSKAVVAVMRRDACTLRPRLASADYLGHQGVPIGAWVLGQADTPSDPRAIFGSNLIAWLAWNLGVSLGTPPEVAAWADQSGNGNDVLQSTASLRPLVASDGVNFDGTDDNLARISNATLDVTSVLTVAIRVKPDVVTSNRCPVARSQTTSGSWSVQTNLDGLRFHLGTPGVNFGEALAMLAAGTERTFVWVFDGTQVGNANRLKLWRDGVAQTLSFTGTVPATVPSSSNTLSVGCFSGPSGQYWDGRIKGVVIARAAATDVQRVAAETYLGGL